ncbi:MAG: ABC transporter ATP-binding protein [Limnochordaceae bacterium]|nr:ABC transporter ATP-binding protein [Limnochordaceae bacterium]
MGAVKESGQVGAGAPPALLELEEVHVFYGRVHALSGLTLHVREGEIVALLGANGAGKSTTLRAISGLVRPASGQVRLDGRPISGLPADAIVSRGVAHVPEGRRVFATLTVEENLRLGAFLRRRDQAGVARSLEWVYSLFPRLAERRRQLAGTLSGGEQQMLAIGRALMAGPRILLLDEPSLGLAPLLVRSIFATLRAIHRQGVAILLVEQNARAALRLAGRAYVLETGHLFAAGESGALAADPRIREAYLGA